MSAKPMMEGALTAVPERESMAMEAGGAAFATTAHDGEGTEGTEGTMTSAGLALDVGVVGWFIECCTAWMGGPAAMNGSDTVREAAQSEIRLWAESSEAMAVEMAGLEGLAIAEGAEAGTA